MFKESGLVFTGSDTDLILVVQTKPNKYIWRIPARQAAQEEIYTELHELRETPEISREAAKVLAKAHACQAPY
ncbi:hypothetical protein C8A01DRAFT_42071 [Parachaetomium inaequale]|uniref:Uncharacterized protein n=1 Tax=Parachaetomium inaequale TaxID=2588326 RepID=A0AAN6P4K1_9PEZI|nr:hypothetical protein C8A01DRAFT_42071 [Parachaetomium inaequale]